jgi:hypothetical protein
MQAIKAKAILKSYQEHDYNASKALQAIGYTKDTSNKQSKPVLNRAIRAIAKEQLKTIESSDNPMRDLFAIVNASSTDVITEYVKIWKQDKDLATKLKALLPLLRELGLTWNEEQVKVQVPVLNLTVSKPQEGLTEPKIG